MADSQQVPQLPPAQDFQRKLQFHRAQRIGIPLIMLIPILALLGLFGESYAEVRASGDALELRVEYPIRNRYWMATFIEISVRNTSISAIEMLTVNLDRVYVDSFSETDFTPNVDDTTDEFYQIEFSDVQPNETRRVKIQLRGRDYGRQMGSIRATSDTDAVEVAVDTFIFP